MATQSNLTVSQSTIGAQVGALTFVNDKDKKKQQEELAKLAVVLQSIEEEIVNAKAGVKGKVATQEEGKIVQLEQPSNADNSAANSPFAKAMAEMVEALQLLQINIVQYGQEKSTMDANISKEQVELSAATLKKTIEQIQKIENMSFWEKIAEWFVAVVALVAGVVTENPVLIGIAVLSALAALGALSKVTTLIADALINNNGVSKDVANIIASVIVTIVVIIVSFGFGALATAPEAVATEATETAAQEVTEELATEASEAGASGAGDTTSLAQKAINLLKKYNFFSKLSPKVNMAILGGIQAISSTGLFNNIVEASNLSKKQKEQLELALTIIVAFLAIIGSIGATSGALGNSMENISNAVLKNTRTLFNLVGGAQAIGGLSHGSFEIAQGVFEKFLADAKADLGLIQTGLQMINEQTLEDQRNMASVMRSQGVSNRDISKIMDGERAFAQLLTAHSPV